MPAPVSFTITVRKVRCIFFYRSKTALRVDIALGLDGFLEKIQMYRHGISAIISTARSMLRYRTR